MFDVGGGELILIVLAIIVLFGPKKIPEIAQMISKGMRQFKSAQTELKSQFDSVKNEINSNISNISSDVNEINSSISEQNKEIKNSINDVIDANKPENAIKLNKNYKTIETNLDFENDNNI